MSRWSMTVVGVAVALAAEARASSGFAQDLGEPAQTADRAANRTAELFAVVCRRRFVLRRKHIAGVHRSAAKESIQRTV